jgi:ElaB/YqjD/DUF883 family membrane-anchored ribosome-binding protein
VETNFDNLQHARSFIARERVLNDLKTLAHDAEDLLKATASDASDKARELRVRLAGTLERAKTTCNELQEQTAATAKAAARRADIAIREHPYESMGAAVAIGFLVGVLVTRR